MSIAALGVASKSRTIPLQSPIAIRCARRARPSSYATLEQAVVDPVALGEEVGRKADNFSSPRTIRGEYADVSQWKKLSSKELGITNSMISKPTRIVLNMLKKNGYQVYLVGGCVRDLILRRTPKDFDVITSANLYQVMRAFPRCEIVGRRFPICHVHIKTHIIEVSSFKTSVKNPRKDLPYLFTRPECDELDFVRWSNCLRRDFTINGLMFDPYSNLVYDYIGGIEDIKKAKVRTVIPAQASFNEDCARILRAIRIAARLDFRFTKKTALSIRDFSCTVLRLDKSRLLMEMNYMLAYGSAEASLRLLWKLGLLDILLPIQAAYFVRQGFRRRDKRTNMLLCLFSTLDRLLAPNRPCHRCLWTGMLAFHHALVIKPREPLVVAAFALVVHNGGDISKAISIARGINHNYNSSFPELLEPQEQGTEGKLVDDVLDLASSVKSALVMLTDGNYISQAMAKYNEAPYSDLVLVSLQVFWKACDMFGYSSYAERGGFIPKRGNKIDYEKLAEGDLSEVRHVFARVIFDTVYPPNPEES